uniref:Uncharacterized protein n=1 Tax=uncultured bacterium contig00021 TaxID=1181511 RepID=A0A806KL26_9BACT|nr:hypothetical protein [uncultured bacterium contig00021]
MEASFYKLICKNTAFRHFLPFLTSGEGAPRHGAAAPLHGAAAPRHGAAAPRHGAAAPQGRAATPALFYHTMGGIFQWEKGGKVGRNVTGRGEVLGGRYYAPYY